MLIATKVIMNLGNIKEDITIEKDLHIEIMREDTIGTIIMKSTQDIIIVNIIE